jgi:hypothetical protein
MKRVVILLVFCLIPFCAWTGAKAEAASSAARGKYPAGRGIIVPPGGLGGAAPQEKAPL